MKIVLLAAASSIHTIRWANSLQASGMQVHIITQHQPLESIDDNIIIHQLPYRGMIGYFTMIPVVKKIISRIQPDIVNAHYASGYGTTARFVGFQPWILSVWGSDIFTFPLKTFFHHWLIKTNILSATVITSTSHCMAAQVKKIAPTLSDIEIIPFGVNLENFRPPAPKSNKKTNKVIIGTIKSMKPVYGVDTLIRSFALLTKMVDDIDLELHLVGGGDCQEELKTLAFRLGVHNKVKFKGKVPHSNVPYELSKLDIYVALSRSESFGVAVIEAGAARKPVIVSDVGGLPEVVVHEVTGIIVPKEDPQSAAKAMYRLVTNEILRNQMGEAAIKHVACRYKWETCVGMMASLYKKTIKKN